ncbi:unnamed protein product [Ambrosiozyma monospora]|uniref:Unnamed protein product n=1 Tax=Ambrosiozyma monospora TaxID=43982 RepID=A0ACB5T4H1_AMBMO|nr:unnamed protein product [Ambrosiozyma monospora]
MHTFNGAKEYTPAEIEDSLGLISRAGRPQQPAQTQQSPAGRYVQQLAICEFTLQLQIESLKVDSFPIPKQSRPARATGAAINVATHLLGASFPKTAANMFLFSGGPCTYGPGAIVSTKLKDPIRSHNDLLNDSSAAKEFKKNQQYYQNIATKAAVNGHTIDIMIGSYDQTGLTEMESLVDKTGGSVVQTDSYTSAIFKQSFQRMFALRGDVEESAIAFNATLEVKVSNNLKINGLVGHGTSLLRKTPTVSEIKVGLGGTDAWKLGSVNPHSTYALYFELAGAASNSPFATFQFILQYQHLDGTRRLHVTTVQKNVSQGKPSLISNFDQEAAAVLVAREAVDKTMRDDSVDLLRWVDKILVDVCANFSRFIPNQASSLSMPPTLNFFPQFMYHLRRSTFVQVFNSSPDETSFYRHCFLTEDCTNALLMIQPSLTAYELDKEPFPVLLDSESIKMNRILILDTFFHLLIFHGSQIAEWRRERYQDKPDYEYFKEFLDLPKQEAAEILIDRFPLPRFIDTEEGGSQARFLMSKLNPSTSYKELDNLNAFANGARGAVGAVVFTDDVSLQTFMKYVNEAIVKTN